MTNPYSRPPFPGWQPEAPKPAAPVEYFNIDVYFTDEAPPILKQKVDGSTLGDIRDAMGEGTGYVQFPLVEGKSAVLFPARRIAGIHAHLIEEEETK